MIDMNNTIAIGSDHAGFIYKSAVIDHLQKKGFEVKDHGTFTEASCDYPDYAHAVAEAVEKENAAMGILICGSANGVAITANKHQGIRAAICWEKEIARQSLPTSPTLALVGPFRSASDFERLIS